MRAKFVRRKGYVQQAILATVGLTGVIGLMMLAPNAVQLLEKMPNNRSKFDYRMRSTASRLAARGYLRFVERGGKTFVEITDAGRRALDLQQQTTSLETRKRRRWDKQWRMVIFDIPERRRATRLRLRTLMQEIGFLRLQDSVWVFPYDCEDLMALLKAELHIGKDVLYVIATQIENDKHIKRHFGLR